MKKTFQSTLLKRVTAMLLTTVLLLTTLLMIPANAASLPQSIGLTGVTNARELGGYRTEDGKTVKSGKLLRTAKLKDATEQDLNLLSSKYQVSKVIDFRTLAEATADPDATIPGAKSTRMSAVDVGTTAFEIVKLVGEVSSGTGAIDINTIKSLISIAKNGAIYTYMDDEYEGLVSDIGSILVYRQFFNLLLEADGATVLYHCASGKDRAGVASILLLSALGVDKETIKEDYLLSNTYYADEIQQAYDKAYSITKSKHISKDVARAYGVDEGWFDTVYSTIESKYGSMNKYLKYAMGLSSSDLNKLKAAYLQ